MFLVSGNLDAERDRSDAPGDRSGKRTRNPAVCCADDRRGAACDAGARRSDALADAASGRSICMPRGVRLKRPRTSRSSRTPALVKRLAGAVIDLTRGVRLSLSGVQSAAIDAALDDLATAGVHAGARGPELRVRVSPALHLGPGAYRLSARNGAHRHRRVRCRRRPLRA